ncbi:hypothetical protein FRB91_011398, partial [Serendipita sp. 411]
CQGSNTTSKMVSSIHKPKGQVSCRACSLVPIFDHCIWGMVWSLSSRIGLGSSMAGVAFDTHCWCNHRIYRWIVCFHLCKLGILPCTYLTRSTENEV